MFLLKLISNSFFNHLNRLDSITAMRAKLNIERLNTGSDRRDLSPVSAQTEGNTFRVEEKSIKIKLKLTTKQPQSVKLHE